MYPDSQQVFVGNLPHNCTEADLESLFSTFGKVQYMLLPTYNIRDYIIPLIITYHIDIYTIPNPFIEHIQVAEIRINSKGQTQSKTLPSGQRVPNFGFVVFETDAAVQDCLKHTPIHLPDGHRLNVETKKNNKVSTTGVVMHYRHTLLGNASCTVLNSIFPLEHCSKCAAKEAVVADLGTHMRAVPQVGFKVLLVELLEADAKEGVDEEGKAPLVYLGQEIPLVLCQAEEILIKEVTRV